MFNKINATFYRGKKRQDKGLTFKWFRKRKREDRKRMGKQPLPHHWS